MESKIEKEFRDRVKECGCRAVKFTDPGEDGAPDRQVLTPWGQVVFVEFKQPGEQPRPNQLRYMLKLCRMGFLAFAANDVEVPMDAIHMLGADPRRDELYKALCERQAAALERRIS